MRTAVVVFMLLHTALLLCAAGAEAIPGVLTERSAIRISGSDRHYVLARPEHFENERQYPLIVAFHGFRGQVKVWFHETSFFNELIPERKFLIAYPEAPISWSADHAVFFDALVKHLGKEFPIDPARIYVVGHSNGAAFASMLAVGRGDMIAAAAFQAGIAVSSPTGRRSRLHPPILVIWGEKDQLCSPHSQTVTLSVKTLEGYGHPVKTLFVPAMDHGWGGRKFKLDETVLDFLFNHSLPLPAPANGAQSERIPPA